MAGAITMQGLIDASMDSDSLETLVNGDDDTQVTTRTGETYPSAKKAIKTMFQNGALPATPFPTYAKMQTEGASLTDGKYAQVTDDKLVVDDVAGGNNGFYIKTSGAWVKSDYDPVMQANAYSDLKVDLVLSDDSIFRLKDANGSDVLIITKNGQYRFLGLENDLATEIDLLKDVANQVKPNIGLVSKDDLSRSIIEVRDSANNLAIRMGADGYLYVPLVGNLTQSVLDIIDKNNNDKSMNVGTKYVDYALASAITNSKKEIKHLITAAEFNALALVSHNVGVLRLPAITRLSQYKFLLFFDAMPAQDDFGIISTCAMTINIDPVTYALTKSNIKVIHQSFDDGGKQRSFIQNVGVKTNTGKVICVYTRRYGQSEHELYMRTSTDDGLTWSNYIDISYIKNNAGLNGMFACSQGFVKRYGRHKGRIVFPVWTTGASYTASDYRAGFIYSDDDGVTWQLGKFAPYSTGNEVQIAEDINGDMLFSIRVQTTDNKILAIYSDTKDEYSRIYTDTVITKDRIMSGLIQGDNKYDFSPAKFTIATAKNDLRTEMLIHTSYDSGKTWATKFVAELAGKQVAYVSLDNITASHKLIIWESDGVKDLSYSVMTIDNFIKGDI